MALFCAKVVGIVRRQRSSFFKNGTLLDCNVWNILHWRGCKIFFTLGGCSNTLPFIHHEPSQLLVLWDDLDQKNYFSTPMLVPFPPVYCTVCAHPLVKGDFRCARSIPNSIFHQEPSEPQFLNVRHKCPPPKPNLVYGAHVPESYLSFPSSLNSISTDRQLEWKTACMHASGMP